MGGYHDIEEYPLARTIPSLIVYRFDAPLFFANADVFQRRVRALVAEAPDPVEWLLLDAEAITAIDSTRAQFLGDTRRELASKGILLVIARAKHPLREHLEWLGLFETIGKQQFYPSIRAAVAAYRSLQHL